MKNPQIEIKSVWEDESLLTVRINASNERFSATADCYTNRLNMKKFAESISGFPTSSNQEVVFSTGENDGHSYFTCVFMPTHRSGNFKVRVTVSHIVTYTNAQQENEKCILEFNIEPAAIDLFANSLNGLSLAPIGEKTAVLHGAI